MNFKTEVRLRDFGAWSGAVDTLERLVGCGKVEEVESYIEECFEDATETDINDFLWFDTEAICEMIGMSEEEFYNIVIK